MTAAVAAPNSIAVRAGLDVVGAGGTAVDAAVAAMLVAMCTEPGVVSPLGGGFVAVWPHDDHPEVIDANVEMPGRGLPRERFGEGLVIRVGLPGWAQRLDDPEVAQLTRNVFDLLRGAEPKIRSTP